MLTFKLADSVEDFSGTQGKDGWQYGYYSGVLTSNTFKLLPEYFANTDLKTSWWHLQGSDYWTAVDAFGGHPHGPMSIRPLQVEQWAVRRG